MFPYLIAFFISIISCYFGEKNIEKNTIVSRCFFVISVLMVSVLAGVRDFNIGTDVMTYGNYVFNASNACTNLVELMQNNVAEIETLYLVLNYVVSRFTNNVNWLYFIIGIITYSLIMLGLTKYKNYISITTGWACFLFLFYSETLNAIRQTIALAIVFWGFHYMLEKKYVQYVVITAVAVLFHVSSILSLITCAVYFILVKKDTFLTKTLIVGGCFVGIMLYSEILELLISIGILPDKFVRYYGTGFSFEINPTIIRLPFLLLMIIYYTQFCRGDKEHSKSEWSSYIIFLVLEMLFVQMRSIMPALYRASFYFGCYKLIAYGRLQKLMNKQSKTISAIIIGIYLLVVWYYQVVIQGNNGTYPYSSSILGIIE